jgi:transcription antitermination protein NusB
MNAAASNGRPAAGATSRARSKGRELALKYLYQADVRKDDAEPFDTFARREDESGPSTQFARTLVLGVMARRAELDALIAGLAKNWSVRRMAILDRNIIRIGAFELLSDDAPPRSVVINEAIELGKRFSTAESGKFINGILDRVGRSGIAPPSTEPTEDA